MARATAYSPWSHDYGERQRVWRRRRRWLARVARIAYYPAAILLMYVLLWMLARISSPI